MIGLGRMTMLTGAWTLASSSAFAQPTVITNPDWARRPSGDEIGAAYPMKALSAGLGGRAVLVCTVSIKGLLENCTAQDEMPLGYGFGEAALRISRSFKMRPMLKDGKPVAGGRISIPINFGAPGSPGVVKNLRWLSAPTLTDVAAAFPSGASKKGSTGEAALTCRIGESGALGDCRVSAEAPRGLGFGAAALRLAPKFSASTTVTDGSSLVGYVTSINFKFTPEMADAASGVMGKVSWVALPSADEFNRAFPDAANQARVTAARIVLACTIGPDGALAGCRADSEDPPNLGFGAAAVAIAPSFRASLWTDEGLPVVGGLVRLPIRFQIESVQPPAVPPPPRP